MSKIFVEKMENTPGIYIIFNIKSKKIYIGKSEHLKERALQHVKNLYLNSRDENTNLQKEFTAQNNKYYVGKLCELKNTGNLEKDLKELESIYYLAAYEMYGKEKIYNTVKLNTAQNQIEKIEQAKMEIKEALLRKEKKVDGETYTDCNNMKDWIPFETISKLKLQSKSIEKMLKNNEIPFLILGKAGEYISDAELPQPFTEILEEKVNQLNSKKDIENRRCLWATSGPDLDDFSKYLQLYRNIYGSDKKLFALFKLTLSQHKNDSIERQYYWEKNNQVYFAKAPDKKTFKALVIRRFYVVREDFDFEKFTKMYYRFSSAAYLVKEKKYRLNNDICNRSTLSIGVLKDVILSENNKELAEMLGFVKAPYLFDELKGKSEINPISRISFNSNEEHPAYYLLAEVEDFVKISKCDKKELIEDL